MFCGTRSRAEEKNKSLGGFSPPRLLMFSELLL
jgi:hypothetical protein